MKIKLVDVDLIRRYGSVYLNADPGVAALLIRKKMAIDPAKPLVTVIIDSITPMEIAEVSNVMSKPTEGLATNVLRPILRSKDKIVNNVTVFPKNLIKEG
jgi:phage tail sheath gpL-like